MKKKKVQRLQSSFEVLQGTNGRKLLRKYATNTGEDELLEQIDFYNNLPDKITKNYPKVIEVNSERKPYFFTMPYYEYPTLTEIFFNFDVSIDKIYEKLMTILKFLFDTQHKHSSRQTPKNYISNCYIKRVRERLSFIASIDEMFSKIIHLESFSVRGVTIDSPLVNLKKIEKQNEVIKKLFPKKIYLTHGQLRFDHILVDLKSDNFILIEPRGIKNLRDIGYELGKIWQCLRSKIIWIEQKKYELNFSYSRTHLKIDHFSFKFPEREKLINPLLKMLSKGLTENYPFLNTSKIKMLTLLAEATHSCAGVPFFYDKEDPSFGLAYYVSGALALQKFVDLYVN